MAGLKSETAPTTNKHRPLSVVRWAAQVRRGTKMPDSKPRAVHGSHSHCYLARLAEAPQWPSR
jgi:hypothetical protein